jgi:hypothetical protein
MDLFMDRGMPDTLADDLDQFSDDIEDPGAWPAEHVGRRAAPRTLTRSTRSRTFRATPTRSTARPSGTLVGLPGGQGVRGADDELAGARKWLAANLDDVLLWSRSPVSSGRATCRSTEDCSPPALLYVSV